MPKYNVTSPSGEKFVVTAPDGATEEEVLAKAQEHFSGKESGEQSRLNKMPSFARAAVGASEAGLQAITGLGSSVLGGIAGIADTALSSAGGGSGAPGDTVRKVQQFGTYQPRTEQGQLASKILGYPFELYSRGVHWAGDKVRGGDSGGARDFAGTSVDVVGEGLPAVLGGVAAFRGAAKAKPAPLTPEQQVLAAAQKEGFTVPPSMAGRPSFIEGLGGKARSAQLHSINNSEAMTALAKRELGIDPKTALKPEVFGAYREVLYNKGYVPLKQRKEPLIADETYIGDIIKLPERSNEIRASFPDAKIAGSEKVVDLANGALQQKMSFSAAVERVRQLRAEAKTNFKAFDKPDQISLAHAQKGAADALEALMERSLRAAGDEAALTRFRMAREHIAKSHAVEKATNEATGVVSARDLKKAPYLTGGLDVAADFARTFEKAVQKPEVIGGIPRISPVDAWAALMTGGTTALATGNPLGLLAAGAPLARPLVAPLTQTKAVQNSLVRNPTPLPPEVGLLPILTEQDRRRRLR